MYQTFLIQVAFQGSHREEDFCGSVIIFKSRRTKKSNFPFKGHFQILANETLIIADYKYAIKCGNRIKFVNFFKTGRDRAVFRVHFAKLRKTDLKSTISFKALTNLP